METYTDRFDNFKFDVLDFILSKVANTTHFNLVVGPDQIFIPAGEDAEVENLYFETKSGANFNMHYEMEVREICRVADLIRAYEHIATHQSPHS
jgi:hypothetical protein